MTQKQKSTVSRIPNPHDLAFKSALSNLRVARQFFETYLPQHIQSVVDLSVLKIQDATFIDAELTTAASDLLYETAFSFEQKEPGYLYILTEHQSTSDYWMPLRILGYIYRILDRHRKKYRKTKRLPLIVPLIFYTGRGKYKHSTDLFQLFGEHAAFAKDLLFGPYTLAQLRDTSDDAILQHRWSGLLEMLMKHTKIRDTLSLLKDVTKVFIEPLLTKGEAEDYVVTMMNYALNVGNVPSLEIFLNVVSTELSKTVGDKLMSIAQQLELRGEKRGEQRGEERGLKRGLKRGVKKGMATGMQLGRQDGLKKAKEARQLFQTGASLTSIAEITGVSVDDLRELVQ